MEHLFKLKKDGKTVGYLKIANNGKKSGLVFSLSGDIWSHVTQEGMLPQFDTAHPFVTKDKNGNDVFAGDEVVSSDGLRKYKVTWDERRCRWWLCGVDKAWAVNEPAWEDYELIEDKEDE